MAKGPNRPYYEVRRIELLPFVGSLVFALLAITIFWIYTPGLNPTLTPWESWGLGGLVAICMGVAAWGAFAAFSERTKRAMASNMIFRMARPEPLRVSTEYYAVNQQMLTGTATEAQTHEIEAAAATPLGTDGYGGSVQILIYKFGGWDAYYYRSEDAGEQGMLLAHGEDVVIETSAGYIIPYTLEKIDHSWIEKKIMLILRDQKKFRPGRTPVFIVGPLDRGIERWLQRSPIAQATVLQAIGLDGMADRFVARIANLAKAGAFPGIETSGQLTPAMEKAILEKFTAWAEAQPGLKIALGNGAATLEYYRGGYWGEKSKNVELVSENMELHDQVRNLTRSITGYTAKVARVMGRQRSLGPSYDSTDRVPGVGVDEQF